MTGWTFQQIGDMTLPQVICKLHKGQKPTPRISTPSQIKRVLKRFREEKELANER